MKRFTDFIGFSGRIIVTHFLTYFFVGLIFYITGLNVVAYYELHPEPLVTTFFRPTSSLLVTVGPLFQLLRGLLFAMVLYPFRKVYLENRWGWLYLWGLFLVFAIFAPSSAAPGSIEGWVYTNFSANFHLIYLPEIILQTLAFSTLVIFWERHNIKKLTIAMLVVFVLVLLMNASALL